VRWRTIAKIVRAIIRLRLRAFYFSLLRSILFKIIVPLAENISNRLEINNPLQNSSQTYGDVPYER